jgi:hypothetical protein
MNTARRSTFLHLVSSVGPRGRVRSFTILALLLGRAAFAPGGNPGTASDNGGAPPARAPADAAERIFLRPRTADGERGRRALREAEESFGLREVTAYESGCRLVERPQGVSVAALRERYGADLEVLPNHVYRVAQAVNDPFYKPYQAAVMEAVHAPRAWARFPGQAPGSPDVVVAVLDTGVDDGHPDLAGSLVQVPGDGDSDADAFGDTVDRNGHGTASAGIIAAQGDNGIGIAGVAWGSRVLPLKCFDDDGTSDDDRLIRCYQRLTALKTSGRVDVRVVNNGWGGLPSAPCLLQAIAAAGDAGILSVFAAGNHAPGHDLDVAPEYPAAAGLPTTMSVAAATVDGVLVDSSNFGATTVDLAAPGVGVTSLGLCRPGEPSCSTLVQVSGTSFAAPFVSGAAALLFAQDPTRTPEQVKRILDARVTSVPALAGKVRSGGFLNIAAALGGDGGETSGPAAEPGLAPPLPFADGTYVVDVAEHPRPLQKGPSIQPEVGYLFVRTAAGVQEQRWLLQGWDEHPFLKPPLHALGMTVRPARLAYTGAAGERVVNDLPSWVAFARSRFVSAADAPRSPSTYAKVATRIERFAGPLSPPFDYPAYLEPAPPVRATVAQIEPTIVTALATPEQDRNQLATVGFTYALSDGPDQTREHWVLFAGATSPSGAVTVGSMGSAVRAGDFAGQMNQQPWQDGSRLVLGSVRYYPSVAESP